MSNEYDVIIKNGTIVDGTGSPAYRGTVAVKGDRIAAITKDDTGQDAGTVVEAEGLTVTPGFIDVHNHGDLTIMHYPHAESFVHQGITTFVAGNCGHSPAPIGEYIDQSYVLYDIYEKLAPSMYYPDRLMHRDTLNEAHREAYGWEVYWHTMGEFLKRLDAKGITANYVPLVGHGRIRYLVLGRDFRRKATTPEIAEMKTHVEQAMLDGCRGMSVGRDYEPGIYADMKELVSCAEALAEYGGVYTSHSLRTGLRKSRRPGEFPPVKLAGVQEAIEVGRLTGVPVQVSHLGSLFDVRPGSALLSDAAVRATLKVIDDARGEGLDVNFDEIPHHLTGGFYTVPYLAALLLPWLKVAGSVTQFSAALKMPEFREEIKEKLRAGKWYNLNPNINEHWDRGRTVVECTDERFHGKTIARIAEESGVDPLDALMDVLMADPLTKAVRKTGDESSKLAFLRHPESMVGVDTFVLDDRWENTSPPWFLPNECSYGGFPRYFRWTVKDTATLTLEEAVRKVTSLPARKFKLTGRGVLKPGAFADIVVMDMERLTDRGDQVEPRRYPLGVEHVFVNGVRVIAGSGHMGVTPGRVLYRE